MCASRSLYVFGVLSVTCLGYLAALPAIVLAYKALERDARCNDMGGRWMAFTGLILGAVSIGISVTAARWLLGWL